MKYRFFLLRIIIGMALTLFITCNIAMTKTQTSEKDNLDNRGEPQATPNGESDGSKWKTVDTDDFKFKIPASLKKQDRKGIDTMVMAYNSDEAEFSLEYGFLVSKEPPYLNPSIQSEKTKNIDHKEVVIVTYLLSDEEKNQTNKHYIRAFFLNPINNKKNLALDFACKVEIDCENLSNSIIGSFRFLK